MNHPLIPTARGTCTAGAFAVLFLAVPPAQGQSLVVQDHRFGPASLAAEDYFGASVAADGKRVAVAELEDSTVHVYARSGTVWVHEFEFQAPEVSYARVIDLDGDRLAVKGNAVVGEFVEVFERGPAGWTLDATIPPPYFGLTSLSSIDVKGDLLVVGVASDDTYGVNSGTAFVFRRVAGSWVLEQQLLPSSMERWQRFGDAVAIGPDYIVVGVPTSPWFAQQQGSAQLFQLTGGAWTNIGTLRNPSGERGSYFGLSLAADGDRVLVGEVACGLSGTRSGGATLFSRAGGAWTFEEQFLPSDPGEDQWGQNVDLDGDRMLVASRYHPRVHLFRETAGRWTSEAILSPGGSWGSRTEQFAQLGTDFVAVGDPYDDTFAHNGGALRIYEAPFVGLGTLECVGGSTLPCPCSNAPGDGSASGCRHSGGLGVQLIAHGTSGVASDDLWLTINGLPSDSWTVLAAARGAVAPAASFEGVLCLGAGSRRAAIGSAGTQSFGPGLAGLLGAAPGETWHFQAAYRDTAATCAGPINWSGAVGLTFTN